MLLPASLYGPYEVCKATVAKAVPAILRDTELREAFELQGWVDTSRVPGLLILHGPSPILDRGAHYQLYLPLTEIFHAVTARRPTTEDMESIFRQALSTQWGLLSLVAITNSIWTYPEHRHAPFLESLTPHWDVFVNEGARYTAGSNTGADLWTHADTVKGVLVRRGIPLEELGECPTAARFAELVERSTDSSSSVHP
jgi:hypothetical protein